MRCVAISATVAEIATYEHVLRKIKIKATADVLWHAEYPLQ
jgi:hypothetical protein